MAYTLPVVPLFCGNHLGTYGSQGKFKDLSSHTSRISRASYLPPHTSGTCRKNRTKGLQKDWTSKIVSEYKSGSRWWSENLRWGSLLSFKSWRIRMHGIKMQSWWVESQQIALLLWMVHRNVGKMYVCIPGVDRELQICKNTVESIAVWKE